MQSPALTKYRPHAQPHLFVSQQSMTVHVAQVPGKGDYHRDAALPLTRENYKKKFTALLYLEEEVHNKLLKEK